MSTDIREQIFQNVKESLCNITNRNGYENDIDSDNVNIIHGKRDDSAYAEPIIYIYPGTERLMLDKCEKGYDYNDLEIQIEAIIRGDKSTMNTNINSMLADMKKALGADHTRGGVAIDTTFMNNDIYINDLTGNKAGIVLNIIIGYETKYANPYEQ